MMMHLARSLLVACAALPALGWAQNYPTRPIRFVVPTAPGGGPDVVARYISPRLTELLGQQVVWENRTGATAMIVTTVGAREPHVDAARGRLLHFVGCGEYRAPGFGFNQTAGRPRLFPPEGAGFSAKGR